MKRIFTARGDRAREWDERHAANEASRERSRRSHWNAVQTVEADMEKQIRSAIPHSDDLIIRVSPGFMDDWEIQIGNSNLSPAGDEPLSWSYDLRLNEDGTVNRKTSSWSGLAATTPESITLLRNTVDTIEAINRMDWTDLLNTARPAYKDYKEPEPYGTEYNGVRPDFEVVDLKDACEEIVGHKDKAIRSKTGNNLIRYYFITRTTPKFVSYTEVYGDRINVDVDIDTLLYQYGNDSRSSFENFSKLIGKDWEVVDIDK